MPTDKRPYANDLAALAHAAALRQRFNCGVEITKLEPFIGPYEYEVDPEFDMEGHPFYELKCFVTDPTTVADLDPLKPLPPDVEAFLRTYRNVGCDIIRVAADGTMEPRWGRN
jgi:hypothetical protein